MNNSIQQKSPSAEFLNRLVENPWMPLWLLTLGLLLLQLAFAPAGWLEEAEPKDAIVKGAEIVERENATDALMLRVSPPNGPWQSVSVRHADRIDTLFDVRIIRGNERKTFFNVTLPITRAGEDLPGVAFFSEPMIVELTERDSQNINDSLASGFEFRFSAREPSADGQGVITGVLVTPFLALAFGAFLAFAGRRTLRQSVVLGSIAGIAGNVMATQSSTVLDVLPIMVASLTIGATAGAGFRVWGVVKPKDDQAVPTKRTFLLLALSSAIVLLAVIYLNQVVLALISK